MDLSMLAAAPDRAFESLVRSTTFSIVAVDGRGRVVLWNRGAERIFGWSEEEVLGRTLPVIREEDRGEFERMRDEVLDGRALDGLEWTCLRADGGTVDVVFSIRSSEARMGGDRTIFALGREMDARVDREEIRRRIELLELRMAESQLPPHFLFNALHSVGLLVRRDDPEQAIRVLVQLGDVLRHALRNGADEPVSLHRELEVLEKYLSVERTRLGDWLRVEIETGPEAGSAIVPPLVLQPLAENALHHGLRPGSGEGTISISAARRGDRLRIEVEDDGVGLPADWRQREARGVGLRGARARLGLLFGEDVTLRLGAREEGGTRAVLDVPYRRSQPRRRRESSG
jgi:PAS domain S-box-containing protein